MDRWFSQVLERATGAVVALALLDRNGNTVALAGSIAEEEAMPLAAIVLHELKGDELAARLFEGEVLSARLGDRAVAVAVARRQLFVVAVLPAISPAALERVRAIRDRVAAMLADETDEDIPPPRTGGGGGGGAGPAELPLIELGVTAKRPRAKA
jgi:hypothetical protein